MWKYSRQSKSTPDPWIHPAFIHVNGLKCSFGILFTETLDEETKISRYASQSALSALEHSSNFTKDLVIGSRNSETGQARSTGLMWRGPFINAWLACEPSRNYYYALGNQLRIFCRDESGPISFPPVFHLSLSIYIFCFIVLLES